MMHEFRRAKRRKAADVILVTDAMTDQVIGRIGNLSETGLLLMARESMTDDAIYQLRFTLPDSEHAVEVGAHLLWQDKASTPGHVWVGFRFIAQVPEHMRRLRSWIEAPGSHYE